MKPSRIAVLIVFAISTAGLVAAPGASTVSPPTALGDKADRMETFKGKVDAVDAAANTLTVEGKVYQITAETKLTKSGNTITLAEIMAGDQVHGLVRNAADGKPVATTVMVIPAQT